MQLTHFRCLTESSVRVYIACPHLYFKNIIIITIIIIYKFYNNNNFIYYF